jgi:LysM repeat protein
MKKIPVVFLILIIAVSCGPRRASVNTQISINHSNRDVAMYTSLYAAEAMQEMSRTGIPASITLSQGIIESDYGRSRLATKANNHFGIKCHSDWKGGRIYHDDDKRGECFRKYKSANESFRDHSDFLVYGSRYSFLFDLPTDDYKGWAKGLKKAGYATNPKYASMLIRTIEENQLYEYDRAISGKGGKKKSTGQIEISYYETDPDIEDIDVLVTNSGSVRLSSRNRILERNRIQYIMVKEGDTYESLAKEFDLLSWEIFRYNDLPDESILIPGQLVYLQPKRNKAEAGKDFHVVMEGETMYTISQLYGIKLKTLYEKNGLVPGRNPAVGTELWLRKVKPEGL